MSKITRHFQTECKTLECTNLVEFHMESYHKMQEQGLNPPAFCEECRKIRQQTHNLFVSYTGFRLDRREAESTLPQRERIYQNRDESHNFNPEKFGVKQDHMREVFDWFHHPHARCGIVRGQTGSGKSTAFLYYLLNPLEGYSRDFFTKDGQIWVTQPRIVAAEGISKYIGSTLLGNTFGKGGLVGTRTSKSQSYDQNNLIVMATDGSVLNLLLKGDLDQISMIIIDEVHQRSTTIDLMMALTLYWMPAFPQLRLLVASATIDPLAYQENLGKDSTAIFDIPGMQPVGKDIIWPHTWDKDPQPKLDYQEIRSLNDQLPEVLASKTLWVLDLIWQKKVELGDILVFLPGKSEINTFLKLLAERIKSSKNISLHELHAEVSEKQKAVLEDIAPQGKIRIIASTNVAEASVTIEGLRHVIDCGLEKQDQWNINEERTSIVLIRTGRSNCQQRWGRVGRTTHGWVYPLYTEDQFQKTFEEYLQPSIERSSLEEARLKLSIAGIQLEYLRLLDIPPHEECLRSQERLQQLQSVDPTGFITIQGQETMDSNIGFTLDHLLSQAAQKGCFIEMAYLIPFIRNGGHRNFLNWDKGWLPWTKYQVNQLYLQLLRGCRDDIEVFLKIVLLAQSQENDLESWFINRNRLQDVLQEVEGKDGFIAQWTLGKKEHTLLDRIRDIDWSQLDIVRHILIDTNPEAVTIVSDGYQFSPWMEAKEQPYAVTLLNPPKRSLFTSKSSDQYFIQEIFSEGVNKPIVGKTLELHLRQGYTSHTVYPCRVPVKIHPEIPTKPMLPQAPMIGEKLHGKLTTYPLICEKYDLFLFHTEGLIIPVDISDLGLYIPQCLLEMNPLPPARFEGNIGSRITLSFLEHVPTPSQEVIEARVIEVSESRIVFEHQVEKYPFPLQMYIDRENFSEKLDLKNDDLYGIQIREKQVGHFHNQSSYDEYLDQIRCIANHEPTLLELHNRYRITRKTRVYKVVPLKAHSVIEDALRTKKIFWHQRITSKSQGGFKVDLTVDEVTLAGFLPFSQTKGRGFIPENGSVSLIMINGNPFQQSAVFQLVPESSIYQRYMGMIGYPVPAIAGKFKQGLGQFFHLDSGVSGLVFHKYLPIALPEGSSCMVSIHHIDLEKSRIDLRLT